MFNYYRKDETDNERYLREELERERDQRRDEEERQYRLEEKRREERREETRQQYESWMRSASDWPDALEKQAQLCWREHNMFPEQNETDDFFFQQAKANEKALEIWKDVSVEKQLEIEELQKQIELVWDKVRNEVADRLIASNSHVEFSRVAETIRSNQLNGYLDW